jgi:hypothetical protein
LCHLWSFEVVTKKERIDYTTLKNSKEKKLHHIELGNTNRGLHQTDRSYHLSPQFQIEV